MDREVANFPMARAWLAAASDLRIRFTCPFVFEARGRTYVCTGLLRDFGGQKGTLICSRDDAVADDVFEVADAMGFYASGLHAATYETYERDTFIRTLNDWGWFGVPENAPSWFTGRLGSHGG
jgi:hypothetical protein